jgi:hypothetical protein
LGGAVCEDCEGGAARQETTAGEDRRAGAHLEDGGAAGHLLASWAEREEVKMNESFYKEQFELRALTPSIWVLTARRLKRSADIIFDQCENDLRAMESGISPLELHNLELAGCATMLYGLALENLLKAIVIQVQPTAIVDHKLRKWPSGGHDLLLLRKEARLGVNDSEKDLLTRLAAFVKWAGRYPIPKSALEMRLLQSAVQPDFVPLPLNPYERAPFDALYARLESHVIHD